MKRPAYSLFDVTGIELEYMIVNRESLAVAPIADALLVAPDGSQDTDYDNGPVTWSNELVLHVMELKVTEPARSLSGLGALFAENVREVNRRLAPRGAMLMPGGMHPLMNPARETRLWPHRYRSIYRTYDRIFGCSRHGWANLQSVHINLPFRGDDEFGRLHAAVRLVLPLIPALAASSPVIEGRASGLCDTRLEVYRTNQKLVPSVTGRVIPERCYTRADYERRIFDRITRDIAPHDPGGTLKGMWLNSRGAIARFDRGAIEIRLMDSQEGPTADLAAAAAVTALARSLVRNDHSTAAAQKGFATGRLYSVLMDTLAGGDAAVIRDADLLSLFGMRAPVTGGEFWGTAIGRLKRDDAALAEYSPRLDLIVERGCLARRITRALAGDLSANAIASVYRDLAERMAGDRPFR